MEMDSDSDIEIPRKRQRTEMFTNECIICGEHGLKEQFCQPKDQESWTKLLEAATLRQFEKLLRYKEHPSVCSRYLLSSRVQKDILSQERTHKN